MKKKKSFLITGGAGFIGSAIANELIKNDYNIKIFDDISRGSKKNFRDIKKKNFFFNGDIRDFNKVFKATKNIDAIIHLAYVNGTKYFYTKPDLVLDVAIKGIINIMDVCIKRNIKELYLASSSEVYQTPNKIPTDENEPLKIPDIFNPRYSYGGGKILTELMGINLGKKYFKKLIIFRPHNVYGRNMGNEHVIPEFIQRVKKNSKKFSIEGTGNETRSFIHIKDFTNAFMLLVKKGKHLNIYNIGTEEKIKIKDLAKMIIKIFNKKKEIIFKPIKKGSTTTRLPDISKIKKLGHKNQIKLIDGLNDII